MMGPWKRATLEVWELDPATGTWHDRTPCTLPAIWPAIDGQMVLGYDRSRRKTVLFGGAGNAYETWEWSGQPGTWERRATAPPPIASPPFDGDWASGVSVLEYNPQRQTLVLPGWDVYEWNGAAATWTLRWSAPVDPTPLMRSSRASFSYDPDRGVVLIFNGDTRAILETNAVRWTNRTPAILPAAWPSERRAARLFYEPTTRQTILAAGENLTIAPKHQLQDLWSFDATTGSLVAGPAAPASWLPVATFAASAGGGKVIVFDQASVDRYLGHTILWDIAGRKVTDLRPPHVPVSWPLTAQGIAAAYDVRRGRVVMFGGEGDGTTNGTSANLLEWNGQDGTWTDRTIVPSCHIPWPPSRRHHVMAADNRRGRILIYSGEQLLPDDRFTPPAPFLGPQLSDYWEWNGEAGTFTPRIPATVNAAWPPATASVSANAGLAYDEARDRVVLVGGGAGNPWEFDPVTGTWTRPPSSGIWNADTPALLYSVQEATTSIVQGPNGGAVSIDSWNPTARSWTSRVMANPSVVGPRWSVDAGAAVDPISGLVWVVGGGFWSWQPGATTWTDRASAALAPTNGNPVAGGVLVFDERRGTLVLLGPGVSNLAVWELAIP